MPLANATTREYWLQVLEDWQASDTTLSHYARQHNLKAHQLRYWKKQLLDQPVVVPALIPMGQLSGSPVSSDPVTLWLSDRYRLELPVDSAVRLIPPLLKALEAES